MKVFINNKVYVSKHDVAFLLREQLDIPHAVLYEIDNETLEQCDEFNAYITHDFMEFTTNDAKEFFKAMAFILDYDDLKDETIESLSLKKKFYYDMQKRFENTFPDLSSNDINGIRNCELAIEMYGHLVMSYEEMIKFKKGLIDIKIPKKDRYIAHKKFLYSMLKSGRNGMGNEKIYTR